MNTKVFYKRNLTQGVFRRKGSFYSFKVNLLPSECRSGVIFLGGKIMENRIAVIGIIVENKQSVEALNAILHDFGDYIIGRMGLPYKEKGLNIISVVVDAPQDMISAVAGKIGALEGVSSKTAFSNVITND